MSGADECGLNICQDGICIRPIAYGFGCDPSGSAGVLRVSKQRVVCCRNCFHAGTFATGMPD